MGRTISVLLGLLVGLGCSSKLDVRVELITAVSPDPFQDVRTVRLRAVDGSRLITVGEGRWDQGPLDLPMLVSPSVERFLVEGLGADGQVISSGASAPLDLLLSPPDGAVPIVFTSVGVLSRLDDVSTARRGGRAVVRADDTVLFLGGADDRGCLHTTTEIYSSESPHLASGPPLVRGRTGDFIPSLLPDGQIVVTGGRDETSCGETSAVPSVVFLDGRTARPVNVDGIDIPGAALSVLPSSEMIIAGGEGDLAARTDVARFDPASNRLRSIGVLDGPRAYATAVTISGGRVALIGGRAQRGITTALASASIFVPSRGAALEEQITIGSKLVSPAAVRTRAGGVLYAGGQTAEGTGHAAVRMLVVRTERDFPLGDTTAVTSMSSTVADGSLLDVGDGSYLFVARDRPLLQWIQLLPRRARNIDGGTTRFIGGGRIADGRTILRDEEGRFHSFNAGVAAAIGLLARDGVLRVDQGGELAGLSAGVVPLRPDAWSLTTRGLTVTGPPSLEGEVTPEERAIFVDAERLDFDVSFDLRTEVGSRAAFLFSATVDRFDHIVLGQRTSAHRGDSAVACTGPEVLSVDDGATHRIRVRRFEDTARVDVDGTLALDCTGLTPRRGGLGFGLVGGSATFDSVAFGVP